MDLRSIAPKNISTPARLFLTGTIFNGIGNGIFGVVLQLYFASMGIGSLTLGSILMMNALSAAILTVPMGFLADRYGKKKIMLVMMAAMLVSVPMLLFTRSVLMFKLAFLSIGVTNAAGVVISPIYSSFFEKKEMDKAFGFYGALNIVTVSLGSLLGFVPPVLVDRFGFTLQNAYWAFLAFGAAFFVTQNVFYLGSIKGLEETPGKNGFKFNIESRDLVAKISLVQILVAVSVGLFFSLFPFYVNKKFGLESDALGSLFFASNLISAVFQAFSSRVSARLGSLKTIGVAFAMAAPFYLLIPFAPSFTWLSALYILRFGFANMAAPLFGSSLMKGLREEEKATANSIRMMAMQAGSVIGPWLGGMLMERATLELPAYLGSGLYAVMAVSTLLLLRNADARRGVEALAVAEAPLEDALPVEPYPPPMDE
ncbi:MAG: MFS transporter [Candidatus Bathyarchaeota archaeon]|nr:MAG: MFS transporter [Candidatus Bathyarchaeota archaeon]